MTTLLSTAAAFGADPNLTTEERAKIISLLEISRDQLLRTVESLTPAQWTFQPAPDKWSAGLITEHIFRSEELLFRKVEEALSNPPNPEWESKTAGKLEFLEKVMPTRQGRAKSPLEIVPDGKLSRQEVLDEFKRLRAKSLAFANQLDKPLKSHTAEHPFPIFNTLNAHQWLIYIPWHTQRHIRQIEEVMSHPGYPKQ